MKVITINDSGFVWHVPLEAIATHRAKYYEERDKDTTFQEEFDFVMQDSYEGLEWFLNNMDFDDVATEAQLIETPKPLSAPRVNSEFCQVEIEDVPGPEGNG